VSGPAYPTPGEAATAYVQEPEYGLEDVDLVHVETDGLWAAVEVTGRRQDASQSWHTVFALRGDKGWTVKGGGGGSGWQGSSWILAPDRGEPGRDGRKGVAAARISVPEDVSELRVKYRRRHLSLLQSKTTVSVVGGQGFMVVWDCHSTWGITQVDARRAGQWESIDLSSRSFSYQSLSQRLAWWWRARRSGGDWFRYEPRVRRRRSRKPR